MRWPFHWFRRRPKVEPLPNPPWSERDLKVAIERQREWMS